MGVAHVYRWELAKLLAQKRTYLGLGAAMLVPVVFVVVLLFQSGGPNDILLGRAGIGISALVPYTATLEELFLGMTEQEEAVA